MQDEPPRPASARRSRAGRLLGSALVLLGGTKVLLSSGACSRYRIDGAWRTEIARAVPTGPRRAQVTPAPNSLVWSRRAVLPAPYREACDLASTPSGLVIAASIDALGTDGAALFRLRSSGGLTTLLTWSGQGFLRVHAYGDRLVVPDADAPFSALSFAFDFDVDGYVFVSDARGALTTNAREVVPRVYHVFDTERLRTGELVASTGAYPSSDVPYLSHRGPAALFVDAGPGHPWRRVLEYPSRDVEGVVRFTYLHATDDGALLAGVQSSVGSLPAAVRIEGLPNAPTVRPVEGIVEQTRRWARFRDVIYHIGNVGDRSVLARSLDAGHHFEPVAAGLPQALAGDRGRALPARRRRAVHQYRWPVLRADRPRARRVAARPLDPRVRAARRARRCAVGGEPPYGRGLHGRVALNRARVGPTVRRQDASA